MKIIKDAAGREWPISLNVYEFKRTRPTFGDLLEPSYFWKKIGDAVFMVDFLFALVQEEAAKRGIDEKAFASAFYGDALESARATLLEEYADFFPRRTGEAIRAATAKIDAAKTKLLEESTKKMDEAAKRLDEAIATAVESSNSPESSASTPTRELGAN